MHVPDLRVKPAMSTSDFHSVYGSQYLVPHLADDTSMAYLVYPPFDRLDRAQIPEERLVPLATGGASDNYWLQILHDNETSVCLHGLYSIHALIFYQPDPLDFLAPPLPFPRGFEFRGSVGALTRYSSGSDSEDSVKVSERLSNYLFTFR